jgi:hypothetical protein
MAQAAKEDKKEAKQKTNEENKRQQRIEDSRANRCGVARTAALR